MGLRDLPGRRQEIEQAIVGPLRGALGFLIDPVEEPVDELKDAAARFLKDQVAQRFGVDLDQIRHLLDNPAAALDRTRSALPGMTWRTSTRRATSRRAPSARSTGTSASAPTTTSPTTARGRAGSATGPVLRTGFAAYADAVTMMKLLMLDGPGLDQLLSDLSGQPFAVYGPADPNVPTRGNV